MTQQPSYKLLFTFIEIDLHLWSLSDFAMYTTVYFLEFYTHLEADSARSFQNAFYKTSVQGL